MNRFYFNVMAFVLVVILILSSCSLFNNQKFGFDIVGIQTNAANKAASTIDSYPFCQFSKYEITVYFVYIALYDPDGGGYSKHTLVNLPENQGVTIDLVTEKLSDKLPAATQITGAAGNAVDKIYIGLGGDIVVNGYIYRQNVLYRSTADGFVEGEGPTEDLAVPMSGFNSIPAFSVDEANPPLKPDLQGIYLWIASGGKVHGHDHVTMTPEDTLEFQFPIDVGVVNNQGSWVSVDVNAATPYVASSTVYEKYYLKRTDGSYYTDMLRFLLDKNGNVILGQAVGVTFDTQDNINNVFGGGFKIWYNADSDEDNTLYPLYWKVNDDGTLYFNTNETEFNNVITVAAFERSSHSGTISVKGTDIDYDCIKVE